TVLSWPSESELNCASSRPMACSIASWSARSPRKPSSCRLRTTSPGSCWTMPTKQSRTRERMRGVMVPIMPKSTNAMRIPARPGKDVAGMRVGVKEADLEHLLKVGAGQAARERVAVYTRCVQLLYVGDLDAIHPVECEHTPRGVLPDDAGGDNVGFVGKDAGE